MSLVMTCDINIHWKPVHRARSRAVCMLIDFSHGWGRNGCRTGSPLDSHPDRTWLLTDRRQNKNCIHLIWNHAKEAGQSGR
jgi:hypothetical protein